MIAQKIFLGSIILLLVFLAFFIPAQFPEKVWSTDVGQVLAAPSSTAFFGYDSLGRDLFVRVFVGLKTSLIVGMSAALIALVIGTLVGALIALSPTRIESLFMRLLDILTTIPHFLWAGALVISFKPLFEENFTPLLIFGIAASGWMIFARHCRNLINREQAKPYCESAIMMGYRGIHLLYRQLLPNIARDLLVYFGLYVPQFVLSESILSFVGIGVQPPQTSLGILIFDSWRVLGSYPHLMLFPVLVFGLFVLCINALIDLVSHQDVKENLN